MENKTNNCKGLIGKILGHKFEPRYNTHSKPQHFNTTGTGWIVSDILDFQKIATEHVTTYNADVCVRCGEVVNNYHSYSKEVNNV